MSDVQRRERSPETASGAQREPDERVREAEALQRELDSALCWPFGESTGHKKTLKVARKAIAALRRLQAAQREPVAEVMATGVMGGVCDPYGVPAAVHWFNGVPPVGTKLYTQAQRDDHPTEGLLRRVRDALMAGEVATAGMEAMYPEIKATRLEVDAALAASKGTPDSMGHPRSRETAAESLSVDTAVADRKDAARYRYLRELNFNTPLGVCNADMTEVYNDEELDRVVDAAMSADVRSQAKEKP